MGRNSFRKGPDKSRFWAFQAIMSIPQLLNSACVCAQLPSCVPLFVTSRTVAHQDPQPMGFTEVGCHFLLQGIFSTQGLNPCRLHLLHCQADSLPLSHLGSPFNSDTVGKAAKSTTEWVWPYSNKTFYPDTKMGISSNFHLAWNIILLIFKPFSNVKTAFSSRASKKQVSDWQWPLTEEPQMSHPDLCESRKLPNELVFNALPDVKILFCWNKVGGFSHPSVNTCYL